jgi:hypothetical protein
MNIPFALISLVMVPLFIRLKVVPGTVREKLQAIDWIGHCLLITSTTCFLVPLTWGGVQYPWTAWQTLAPLLAGVAGLVGFAFYEMTVPAYPIIRLDLLSGNYNLAYSLCAAVINALIVYGSLYFLPLYYEAVQAYDPIRTGVAMFPATLTIAPMAVVSGVIISKSGDFKIVTVVGWALTTIGMGILVLLDVHTTIVQFIFLTLCSGVGLGLLYASLAFINQSSVGSDNMTFAVGMFVFARYLGQCLGVAICSVIFQNKMYSCLLEYPDMAPNATAYMKDAAGMLTKIHEMEEGLTKRHLIQAYADSLKFVWIVLCILSSTVFIGSLFVKKVSLDQELKAEQSLQPDKKN